MNSIFISPKSQTQGFLAEIDPRIKILTFLALVMVVILTPSSQFLKFGFIFAALLILIISSRLAVAPILFRLFLVGSMVFFIGVLVFAFQKRPAAQNLMVIWNILIKTILVVITLSVLTQTTEFYRLIKALESFKIPRLVLSLLGFTYRYLQLLYDECITVKRAVDSRSLGKRGKIESVAVLKSALVHVFLRTFERSERIYAAMLSRGYEGTISTMDVFFFKRSDFVFACVAVIFICIVLVVI